MLDSPERVSAGQARFKYPATFVLFSKATVQGKPILLPSSGRDAVISTRPELAASPPLVPHEQPQPGPHARVQDAAGSLAGATAPV